MRKSCFAKTLCAFFVCTLFLTRTGAAQEVYFDDFDGGRRVAEGVVSAIGGGQRAAVEDYAGIGHAGNEFGGQYFHYDSSQSVRQEFRASPITLTLTDLPPHEFVSLDFLFARIGTWDGDEDFLSVRVDRQLIFSESFDFLSADQQTFEPDTGVLLVRDAPLLATTCCDAAYDMSLQQEFHRIPHVADSLFVEWFPDGDGWQGGNDESFAIENVRVVLSGEEPLVSIPEPTAVEYLLAAFLSFGFGRRRRRRVRHASRSSVNTLCGEFLESRECLTASGIQATSIIPPYQTNADPLIAVVDMNADGIRDIVDFRNGIYVAQGLGEGRYQLPKYRGDVPALVSRVIGVGDLDGDGDEDVMLSSIVSVSWIENDPTSDELRVHDFFQDRRVHDVVLADLNDDGRLDVSLIHEDSVRQELLSTFIAADGNNFEQLPAVSLQDRFDGSIGSDIYISDFNSDGFLDVVASHAARPWRISWVPGIGPGRLADDALAIVASDSPVLGLSSALQARVLPFTVLENSVFIENGGNVDLFAFEAGEITHQRIPDVWLSGEMAFLDVDDDGNRDLIALTRIENGSTTNSLEWFPSDGEEFGEAIPINRFAETFDVAEADSGRLEIIVGSLDRVSVYTQMDNGLFAESSQPFRFGLSSDPMFADVDGDGMQDMVTAWNSGFVYAVHRGDGHTETMSPLCRLPTGHSCSIDSYHRFPTWMVMATLIWWALTGTGTKMHGPIFCHAKCLVYAGRFRAISTPTG